MRQPLAALRVAALAAVLTAAACAPAAAQGRGAAGAAPQQPGGRGAAPQGRGAPAATPRDAAPIDLTGYWVSIVNEDWRWRMVTPPKGDYASVPLNAEGRKVADSWEPSQDGRCDAYGAAGIMRIPTRLHITWEDASTLKIDVEAGRQTRRLLFDAGASQPAPPTLQGRSVAEWERPGGGRGGGGRGGAAAANPQGGSVKVVTTGMTGGWLRKNGVPYSADAVMTEHFDRFTAPNGDEWLVVTTIVSDPQYLTQEFVTSTHFRKEADGSRFSATPCRAS